MGRALDVVELMNVGMNYMREHIPADARVHYAVTNSGGDAPKYSAGICRITVFHTFASLAACSTALRAR